MDTSSYLYASSASSKPREVGQLDISAVLYHTGHGKSDTRLAIAIGNREGLGSIVFDAQAFPDNEPPAWGFRESQHIVSNSQRCAVVS